MTSGDVLAATPAVAVGIEILDSRYQDYKFTMADVVADNTSAGRFVVGPAMPAAGLDLRLLGVLLEHNGQVIATAAGAAALGHPASAVAWLVAIAGRRRTKGCAPAMSCCPAGSPRPCRWRAGDVVTATADRLGSVEIGCQ